MPHEVVGFHLTIGYLLSHQWGIMLPSVMVGLVFIVIGIVLWLRRHALAKGASIGILLAIVGVVSFALGPTILLSSELGTGWTYTSSGALSVNTSAGNITIPLQGAKIRKVSPNGSYALNGKIAGTNSPGLNEGRFHLVNGIDAYVFQYGSESRYAIQGDNVTIIISSPNASQLQSLADTAPALPPSATSSNNHHSTLTLLLFLGLQIMLGLIGLFIQLTLRRKYAPSLPEKMATHFNIAGQPDNWMSKRSALRIGPILSLSFGAIGVGLGFMALMGTRPGVIGLITALFLQGLMLVITMFIFRVNKNRL